MSGGPSEIAPQEPDPRVVTGLLEAAHGGDAIARDQVLELIWTQLRRLAVRHLARRAHETIEPTALVHEVFMRLVGPEPCRFESRAHFFGSAARCMRRLLIDRAREAERLKRGGGRVVLSLDSGQVSPDRHASQLLSLDDALDRLNARDERKHEIVMLRFFAGLTVEETAACLAISPATVKADWSFARAWLQREIESA